MIIDTNKLTDTIKKQSDEIIKEAKGHGSLMDLVGKFKWVLGGIILTIMFPKMVMFILVGLIAWYLFTAYYEKNKSRETSSNYDNLVDEYSKIKEELKREQNK